MNPWWLLLGLAACVVASFVYSGSEIGFYSLTRLRVDIEANRGHALARLVARMMEDQKALLVTILIGNNLAIELATLAGNGLAARYGPAGIPVEVLVTVVLTPLIFLCGELLPKELYRRRPHELVVATVPFVALSHALFLPLEIALRVLTHGLENLLGIEPRREQRLHGREGVLHALAEGTRSGVVPVRAQVLAHNALRLRSIPVVRAMRPWAEVVRLERGRPEEELRERVREARYSRLPVVDEGGRVEGYVHQIDCLTAEPGEPLLGVVHSLPALPESTPVDRALLTLRGSGRRLAVVGSPEAPLGIVSLKDLVEEISGDLAEL